jgi:hypothetical protein
MLVGYLAFWALAIVGLATGLYFWLDRSKKSLKHLLWLVTIIAIIALVLIISGIVGLRSEIATGQWPPVDGSVISSKVVGEKAFHPEITYSYMVNGSEYSHTSTLKIPGFGGKRNRLELAEYLVAQYPSGRTISVFYNPDDPSQSELKTGITYRTLLETALGVVLLVIAGILVIPLYRKTGVR